MTMICLSADKVMLGAKPSLRIVAHVSEDELYDRAVSTLESVREVLQSGVLPKKRFRLPPTPFAVGVPGDTRAVVIESAEAWEGDFPGKRLTLISMNTLGDFGWLLGKDLEVRQL
jgi:hypothetical protein